MIIPVPSLGSVILESKITPDHPYQKQEVVETASLKFLVNYLHSNFLACM